MSRMLHHAALCAVYAHMGHDRKDGLLPYITHPFEVMKRLRLWGVQDEELLAAALLHDTLEDTHTGPETIAAVAGPRTLALVEAVTWHASVGSARTKFEALCELPVKLEPETVDVGSVLLLKMADRFCNVLDFAYTAELTGGTDPYPSRYALIGFPVFHAWLQRGRTPNPRLARDLETYEEIVRRRYLEFRIKESTIETVHRWLFTDDKER